MDLIKQNIGLTISILATIITTFLSIYYGFKSARVAKKFETLQIMTKRISWEEVEIGITKLFDEVEKKFHPEAVLCMSERGAAIITMVYSKSKRNLPVFISFWQSQHKKPINMEDTGFIELESRNRKFYLPESILKFKGKKILIMDDWSYSGDAMCQVYSFLSKSGIPDSDMRFMTLVASNVAKKKGKPTPNQFYSYYTRNDNDFYFPWGKAT
ncbi:hypothetical protein [Draconibacterium sediminis]|uniref:Phosphoribosyltransferase domain-containing protein n=1 Tax=Draconibacterium sediminis TaxID=1544798 RepID=A0A0D8J9N9_9BACT|nr:hypothetical protein [Draconibacterium sediminis]KJF43459.1 hypothetical protein LH29_14640 [Draconibacterium sediminis]